MDAAGGVVPVAKPTGPTSHDVVAAVRRRLGGPRTGHLGTLDPMAAGVLVVVVGRATRLARFAAGWPKTYEGVARLGTTTTTDDATGAPLVTSSAWQDLPVDTVEAALAQFRGTFAQRPPAYSAVNVAGERAYRRARRGEPVEPPPRPVTVSELALLAYEPPDVRFRATVSAGTYLRSVARDLGAVLGCGAHLAALTRTAVGPFRLDEAVAPETVGWEAVRSPVALVSQLPRRDLSDEEAAGVAHGRPVAAGPPSSADGADVALFHRDTLMAVATAAGGQLKPRVVVGAAGDP